MLLPFHPLHLEYGQILLALLKLQDVPARYSPQMGLEGANVIFDAWVHPLMMGLEEHLIGMFRHDFEFVDGHRSHLGEGAPASPSPASPESQGSGAVATASPGGLEGVAWTADGEAELAKIPFFVRGKVRRNTETFARERQVAVIDAEMLYEAKAHLSRS